MNSPLSDQIRVALEEAHLGRRGRDEDVRARVARRGRPGRRAQPGEIEQVGRAEVAGDEDGVVGNVLARGDETLAGQVMQQAVGEIVEIVTPGAGGYGPAAERSGEDRERDLREMRYAAE